MFTGIIEAVGTVVAKDSIGGDLRVRIHCGGLSLEDVNLGDSIATNGVCLTVVSKFNGGFSADVSVETLAHSTLGLIEIGSLVNLEKALTLATRLGGHLVSGHIDGTAKIVEYRCDARSIHVGVKTPTTLLKYLARKGSVCVDGVSLTINRVEGDIVHLNIVPHTAQGTTIKHWKIGTTVNIEVDLLARYLERLLQGEADGSDANRGGVSKALLASRGYI